MGLVGESARQKQFVGNEESVTGLRHMKVSKVMNEIDRLLFVKSQKKETPRWEVLNAGQPINSITSDSKVLTHGDSECYSNQGPRQVR